MRLVAVSLLALAAAAAQSPPAATTPAASAAPLPKVRHIIGLDGVKGNASGVLSVREGMLRFQANKAASDVPISSIDDVFIGTETTQGGGKTGRVIKTAAIAAPFESGKALTILMRTKVDILTVAFRDSDNALHGVIFALPKGQGDAMRSQLIAAGARTSPAAQPASQEIKQ